MSSCHIFLRCMSVLATINIFELSWVQPQHRPYWEKKQARLSFTEGVVDVQPLSILGWQLGGCSSDITYYHSPYYCRQKMYPVIQANLHDNNNHGTWCALWYALFSPWIHAVFFGTDHWSVWVGLRLTYPSLILAQKFMSRFYIK